MLQAGHLLPDKEEQIATLIIQKGMFSIQMLKNKMNTNFLK